MGWSSKYPRYFSKRSWGVWSDPETAEVSTDSSSAVASFGSFESWVVAASLPQPSRSQSSAAELHPYCKPNFKNIWYDYITFYVFEAYYTLLHRWCVVCAYTIYCFYVRSYILCAFTIYCINIYQLYIYNCIHETPCTYIYIHIGYTHAHTQSLDFCRFLASHGFFRYERPSNKVRMQRGDSKILGRGGSRSIQPAEVKDAFGRRDDDADGAKRRWDNG